MGILDDPETLQQAYDMVNEAIVFHQHWVGGNADTIVLQSPTFNKEWGVQVLEAILAQTKEPDKQNKLKEN